MRRILVAVIALSIIAVSAGCAEKEQAVSYQNGKYRGKPDTRPWDNPPPANGAAAWNKGDHATWENQLRTRGSAQNENRRIGH